MAALCNEKRFPIMLNFHSYLLYEPFYHTQEADDQSEKYKWSKMFLFSAAFVMQHLLK